MTLFYCSAQMERKSKKYFKSYPLILLVYVAQCGNKDSKFTHYKHKVVTPQHRDNTKGHLTNHEEGLLLFVV